MLKKDWIFNISNFNKININFKNQSKRSNILFSK